VVMFVLLPIVVMIGRLPTSTFPGQNDRAIAL
jgi:hypothetical protein